MHEGTAFYHNLDFYGGLGVHMQTVSLVIYLYLFYVANQK